MKTLITIAILCMSLLAYAQFQLPATYSSPKTCAVAVNDTLPRVGNDVSTIELISFQRKIETACRPIADNAKGSIPVEFVSVLNIYFMEDITIRSIIADRLFKIVIRHGLKQEFTDAKGGPQ